MTKKLEIMKVINFYDVINNNIPFPYVKDLLYVNHKMYTTFVTLNCLKLKTLIWADPMRRYHKNV